MTEHPYITSDVPVVFLGADDKSVGFGVNGIAQSTTIISMPLTPQHLITVYHKKSIAGQCTKLEDQCILLDHSEKAFIAHVNQLQFKNCWRQVYTHPDAGFPVFPH